MKRHDSDAGQLIRGVRPESQAGFPASRQGETMLARILDTPRQPQRRSRRTAARVAGAVVLGALFAGGATAAIGAYNAPTAPFEALPANGDAFVCATANLQRMGDAASTAGESPVDACRRSWSRIFGDEAPNHLYPCVKAEDASPSPGASASPSSTQWNGLIYVLDGQQFKNAPETCGSVGMLVAPTVD
ncbi:hypothetical protein C1I95_04890 [Micromonospora craterilacus]|uniref:Uncharacterized protein n=2 Tax=Micromonospora craterilacus TaxID=1655439 RepID=A0A2W2EIW2_9ACTN|nr:hypothetical protein C1I95_04890 [Micromonospora craterilacus]